MSAPSRRTYNSFVRNGGEDEPLLQLPAAPAETVAVPTKSLARKNTKRSFTVFAACCCAAVLSSLLILYTTTTTTTTSDFAIVIPTSQEAQLMQVFDMHAIGSAGRIRRAQSIAKHSYKHAFLKPDRLKMALLANDHEKKHKHNHHGTRAPEGCEATVVLMRHCEKGNIREHCDYVGFERSVYLATLFGDDQGERWPAPNFIFAQGPGGRHRTSKLNFREIETAGPLAKKVGVSIDYSYSDKTINHLAEEILQYLKTGQMCGKVAVVVWKHSMIGHLAHHLGCGPVEGCPVDYSGRDFDQAWQLKFVYRRPPYSSHKSLSHKHKPIWTVYGSVQHENFDPLAFSKLVGDYATTDADIKVEIESDQADSITVDAIESSDNVTANWQAVAVQVPERPKPTDRSTWEALKTGAWPDELVKVRKHEKKGSGEKHSGHR